MWSTGLLHGKHVSGPHLFYIEYIWWKTQLQSTWSLCKRYWFFMCIICESLNLSHVMVPHGIYVWIFTCNPLENYTSISRELGVSGLHLFHVMVLHGIYVNIQMYSICKVYQFFTWVRRVGSTSFPHDGTTWNLCVNIHMYSAWKAYQFFTWVRRVECTSFPRDGTAWNICEYPHVLRLQKIPVFHVG